MSIKQFVVASAGQSGGTLTWATTPTSGSLLIAFGVAFGSYSSVSSRWTTAATISDDNSGLNRVFYRYADGTETLASSLFVPGNASYWDLAAYEVSSVTGVFATDVLGIQTGKLTSGATFTSTPAYTVANSNTLMLGYVSNPGAGSLPPLDMGSGWAMDDGRQQRAYATGYGRQYFTAPSSSVITLSPGSSSFSRIWMMAKVANQTPPPTPSGFAASNRTFPLGFRDFPQRLPFRSFPHE